MKIKALASFKRPVYVIDLLRLLLFTYFDFLLRVKIA